MEEGRRQSEIVNTSQAAASCRDVDGCWSAGAAVCMAVASLVDWHPALPQFVILGLDPRIHAGTCATPAGAAP
jgi:hypothetical protein